MPYDFVQVDAFTNQPLYGNPPAVIFDADDIPAQVMQKIAREMNLSETVFILKPTTPDADYRVRIFSPMNELPFAGHPTVAAAHAVLGRYPDKANASLLCQECGIGIVPVEVLPTGSGKLLRMTQGIPTHRAAPLSRATVAQMLGCADTDLADSPFEVISTGIPWLIAELSSFDAIQALNPDLGLIARECKALGAVGLTVFVERGEGPACIRVRTFVPGEGVAEDPACGSGNGCVAAYIARHKPRGNPTAATWPNRVSKSTETARFMRRGNVKANPCAYASAVRLRLSPAAKCIFSSGQARTDGCFRKLAGEDHERYSKSGSPPALPPKD